MTTLSPNKFNKKMKYDIKYNGEIIDTNRIDDALSKNDDWRHLYPKYENFLKDYIHIIDPSCDVNSFYEKYCINYDGHNRDFYSVFEYNSNTIFITCISGGISSQTMGVTINDNGEIIHYNDDFYNLRFHSSK